MCGILQKNCFKFIGAGYTRKFYHISHILPPEVAEIGNDGYKKASVKLMV